MSPFFLPFLFVLTLSYADFTNIPDTHAFLEYSATDQDAMELEQEILQIDANARVEYISKEDAYQEYVEQNQSDPLLIELITPEVMPASLEIKTSSRHTERAVKEMLEKSPLVDEVIQR